jgi:hypothetical protein
MNKRSASGLSRSSSSKGQFHEIFYLCFFIQHLPLGQCFTSKSVFAYNFEFAEIFEFKVDSTVSMTLPQATPIFKIYLRGLEYYSSPLLEFDLIFSVNEMSAFYCI